MIDINFIDGGTDERILKSLVGNDSVDQELLEKAIRDRSKLVPKVITDKNGHRRTVYIKAGSAVPAQPKATPKEAPKAEEKKSSKKELTGQEAVDAIMKLKEGSKIAIEKDSAFGPHTEVRTLKKKKLSNWFHPGTSTATVWDGDPIILHTPEDVKRMVMYGKVRILSNGPESNAASKTEGKATTKPAPKKESKTDNKPVENYEFGHVTGDGELVAGSKHGMDNMPYLIKEVCGKGTSAQKTAAKEALKKVDDSYNGAIEVRSMSISTAKKLKDGSVAVTAKVSGKDKNGKSFSTSVDFTLPPRSKDTKKKWWSD